MRFYADDLSRAWHAVACASIRFDHRPVLDRTIVVEQYRRGIRLVATDGVLFATTFVPECEHRDALGDAPPLEEEPIGAAVLVDEHGRGRSLMAHLAALVKAAKKDGDPVGPAVVLSVAVIDDGALPGFEARSATIELLGAERLRLPVYEGTGFPAWRSLLTGRRDAPTAAVSLAAESYARLAKIAKAAGVDLRCEFAGELGPIMFRPAETFGNVVLEELVGLVMPLRTVDA